MVHPRGGRRHDDSGGYQGFYGDGGAEAIDQRLNSLFGEVESLRTELHGRRAEMQHISATSYGSRGPGVSFAPHHAGETPRAPGEFIHPTASTLRSAQSMAFSPTPMSHGLLYGTPTMSTASGRVPPPRVLDVTLTRSPHRDVRCGTDDFPEMTPGPRPGAAEEAGGVEEEEREELPAKPDPALQRAEEEAAARRKREREAEAEAAEEARREAEEDLRDAAVFAEEDIDRTEEVLVRVNAQNKLAIEIREEDLVVHDVKEHSHNRDLQRLVGWTLTHVNGAEISHISHIGPALTKPKSKCIFKLMEPQPVAKPEEEERGSNAEEEEEDEEEEEEEEEEGSSAGCGCCSVM